MPLVDVTDILFDPDIAGQSFTVLRRQEVVNGFGESRWITSRIKDVIGSVQPEGSNDLDREDAYDIMTKTVIVVTTYRLRGVAKGPGKITWKPDIIEWNSNHYEVVALKSWGTFGAGFVEATCSSIKNVDFPPFQLAAAYGQLDFSRPENAIYALGAGG
jgi:hypothetical protein